MENTESMKTETNQTDDSKKSSILKYKKLWIILAVVLAQIGLIAGIFSLGYTVGKDVGAKQVTVDQSLVGINSLLGSVSNPYRSVTGTVSEVSSSSIVVVTQRGEKKSVKLTDTTQVTNKAKAATISDIKKGNTVSVFLADSSADNPTATRVVISR